MKQKIVTLNFSSYSLIVAFILMTISPRLMADDKKEVDTLLKKFDQLWFDDQTYAELDMKVKTNNYERELNLKYWGKGPEMSLVRITFPPKEKGVSTLKAGKDVYNFVPKTARTTKITEALLSQSWMGSHFSNSDLMRTVSIQKEYDVRVLEKKPQANGEIWVLEANAKPNVATLFRKLILQFDQKTKMPLEQKVFDKADKLIRTFSYLDVKSYSGKIAPSRVMVTPELSEQKGEFTEVYYTKINRNIKISDDTFSLSNLTEI